MSFWASVMGSVGNGSIGLEEYTSNAELPAVVLYNNCSESDRGEPLASLRFASVCCVLFMLIGCQVRNATAILIINLSCSDLLFCCFILPLAASTFWTRSWPYGKILCTIFPYARYALVSVSLFTVMAITINRYIMIAHPMLYPRLYTKKYLSLMIASVWLFSFGLFIPICLGEWGQFRASWGYITRPCTIISDERVWSPRKFLSITAFVLPSLVIILCYTRILWIVRNATKQSRAPIHRPPTELQIKKHNSMSIENDLDQKQKPKNCSLLFHCFMNPVGELSSSCGSTTPEDQERKFSSPKMKPRTLGSEIAKYFRRITIRRTATPTPRLPTKKDEKLLTMIVAIMVSFCVCHLPITLAMTIFDEFTSHPWTNSIGYVLVYLPTCINPVVYVVMSSEYRQAYKSVMKCRQ